MIDGACATCRFQVMMDESMTRGCSCPALYGTKVVGERWFDWVSGCERKRTRHGLPHHPIFYHECCVARRRFGCKRSPCPKWEPR